MSNFRIFKISTSWSTSRLMKDVEKLLKEKTEEGYEVVSVAFGVNLWAMPTAFVTFKF